MFSNSIRKRAGHFKFDFCTVILCEITYKLIVQYNNDDDVVLVKFLYIEEYKFIQPINKGLVSTHTNTRIIKISGWLSDGFLNVLKWKYGLEPNA